MWGTRRSISIVSALGFQQADEVEGEQASGDRESRSRNPGQHVGNKGAREPVAAVVILPHEAPNQDEGAAAGHEG
jgi:hypothetical protein